MKRSATLLLTVLLLLGFTGCNAMSASQQFRFTSNGYQATGNVLASLIEVGVVDDPDDIRVILAINDEVKIELDAWYDALVNDVPLDAQFVKRRVDALLGRLVQYQLDAERKTAHDGTDWNPPSDRDADRVISAGEQDRTDGEASADRGARLDPERTGAMQSRQRRDAQPAQESWSERARLALELRQSADRYARLSQLTEH